MFLLHAIDQTVRKLKMQTANILTLFNLSLGGLAILAILHDQLNISVVLIFLAALADRFDGMIARKLNIESELGRQLDSMCDIVSFGIAPALLIYDGILIDFGAPGAVFTILYIACGAYRLARFNITENNGYFTGVPITVAGCIATLSYLALPYVEPILFVFLMIILSILMVSPITMKKI